MNTPRFVRFVRSLPALALLLGLSLATPAQQEASFSVHGGPATGLNSANAPSRLMAQVKVGGAVDRTSVAPAAGQTAAQVSASQEAAFQAKGYATRRDGPNDFAVTAGPGGAPLTDGAGVGNDDTGLDIDCGIKKLPAAPGAPPPDPKDKNGGGGVGVPPDHQPPVSLPHPVVIIIIIEIRLANGTVIVIRVPILILPGMDGPQIRMAIEQALRSAGLLPNRVRWHSVLDPYRWVDGFQLDRTVNGDQVQHLEYEYDAMARRVLPPQELTAGMFPSFGATDYGQETRGAAPARPWAVSQGNHRVGGYFDVVYHLALPSAPGGEIVSLGRQLPATPLCNGYVLVDLPGAVFGFGLLDPSGDLRRSYLVPPAPALVGLPLNYQGLALDQGSGLLTMTNGIAVKIGQ